MASSLRLGRIGVWCQGSQLTPELAQHLERLGFGTIWIGGSPSADLQLAEALIAATERITIATGIVNIWTSDPLQLAVSYHRIESAHPGRLVVGIGAGHPERIGSGRFKPYTRMVEYLDYLDLERVPVERRILAALGPKMLRLSAERAAGAHPYLVTPEFTARARETLGDGPVLAPEQRVVLRDEADEARRIGRPSVARPYLGLKNYVDNLRTLGFGDDDLAGEGSDRLIDALVAYGPDSDIAGRIQAHLDAGADHVAVQLLTGPDDLVDISFTRLAHILLPTGSDD